MTFKERCLMLETCLPLAGYRLTIAALHKEMLEEITRLQNELSAWESAESHCAERLSEVLEENAALTSIYSAASLLGSIKSEKKKSAAQINGAKGGRPKKPKVSIVKEPTE